MTFYYYLCLQTIYTEFHSICFFFCIKLFKLISDLVWTVLLYLFYVDIYSIRFFFPYLFRCVLLLLGATWLQQRLLHARHVTSPSSVWQWESPPSCCAPYLPLWSSSPLSTMMTTGSPRDHSSGTNLLNLPYRPLATIPVGILLFLSHSTVLTSQATSS